MANFIVISLLLSIGAGLAGWGINQTNRWLSNLSLGQRLLIGSLTAPVCWLLFCASMFAFALSKVPPDHQAHRSLTELPIDGSMPVLSAFLGLLGFSWAGGLVRAWFAYRSHALGQSQPLMNFFPFIRFGLLPLIAMVATVQIWREQGDVPDQMKVIVVGAALFLGFFASFLSNLGLAMHRLKDPFRPIPLRIKHLALVLIAGPVLLGLALDIFAGDARVQGIATLFAGAFAVGAAAYFLRLRSLMRARVADTN